MFRNSYEHAQGLVLSKNSYIDSVTVFVDRVPAGTFLAQLKQHCGTMLPGRHMPHQHHWAMRFTLHQPRTEAFYLILHEFKTHLLNRADVALDLVTRKQSEAAILQGYLERHLVQRWHGQMKPGKRYRDTHYSAAKRSPNVIATYSDKPSKIDGAPCCHVEWRMKGAESVKRAGLYQLEDLVSFDHRAFWKDRLNLYDIPSGRSLEKLGMMIKGQPRRQKPWIQPLGRGLHYNFFVRIASVHIRKTASDEDGGEIRAQVLIDRYGAKWKKYLGPLDNVWLLPEAHSPRQPGGDD